MKTHRKTKTPRARVMFTEGGPDPQTFFQTKAVGTVPSPQYTAAVIPTATAKQARAIVKAAPFLTMTEEEQLRRITESLGDVEEVTLSVATYVTLARAVLAAIGGAK